MRVPPFSISNLETEEEVPGRYVATAKIGNCSLHVELIEVDSETGAMAMNPELQDRIEGVRSFDDYQDEYESVIIGGRPHFVIIHPFAK